MLRIAERIACREHALGLVSGDSLGQVASQTLEAMTAVGEVAELRFAKDELDCERTGFTYHRVEPNTPPGFGHRHDGAGEGDVAAALRARSKAAYLVSDVMRDHNFVNVETPFLTRSTPEGARDFLVPVRLQPGSWYALPQSPQLFKQLLMVSGLERYYQLVRCFRDEDFRADRQPEFTQVDIETAFLTEEQIMALMEDLICTVFKEVLDADLPNPFPRISHAEAMARYGSDKPDLRVGMPIEDLSAVFAGSTFGVFRDAVASGGAGRGLVVPGGATSSRRGIDGPVARALTLETGSADRVANMRRFAFRALEVLAEALG